jgi:ABC-type dipeptide/oligopeptide/nickel transport system ATPase component
MSEEIFLVKNLKINYLCGDQRVKALENINFNLKKNEIL